MSHQKELETYAQRHYESHLKTLAPHLQKQFITHRQISAKGGLQRRNVFFLIVTGSLLLFGLVGFFIFFLNPDAIDQVHDLNPPGPLQASVGTQPASLAPWGLPDADIIDRHDPYFVMGFPKSGKTVQWICYKIQPGSTSHSSGNYRFDANLGAPQLSDHDRRQGYVMANLIAPRHIRGLADYQVPLAFFSVKSLMKQELHRGSWSKIVDTGLAYENVWVTVGTQFDQIASREQDPIPSSFFIIFARGQSSGPPLDLCAFLVPNQLKSAYVDPSNFLVSIDQLETVTQLDFFSDLSDQRFESVKTQLWSP